MSYVEPLMRRNFLEYASYVIIDRAIPDVRDGCKPVQRRILTTLFEMDDGRFHKVANVIGETMKLHPHGDASIGDALVVLANKEYFIEKQGNFGNLLTGHPAAAARYIECRLTPLALETLFNKKLTEYRPSYDGRKQEPVFLPAKLPVVLLLGTEGIAVGMATRILPHNFCELLEGQIAILRGQRPTLYPDFPQGGLMDVSEYDDGRGRVRVRARLERPKDGKRIIVREVPYATTTESLIASIEAAVQKGKLKVASIEDRTAEEVEIVLHLPRGVYADEVEPQLYAYTSCEVPISSNLTVIRDGEAPAEMTVSEVLDQLTKRLREQIKAELELELRELEDKQHAMTLEQIFIENRVYKLIETERTAEGVRKAVFEGMEPYRMFFVRDLVAEDVERLLEIRIRRISVYDINKYRQAIDDIVQAIAACQKKLRSLTKTVIAYLEDLIARYGERYPRRTEMVGFDLVSKKEVARQSLKLSYDPESGFFGSEVRGGKHQLTISEYDKVLIVSADGYYKVVAPPQKMYVGKALAIEELDPDTGVVLTYVYRDPDKHAWGKQVHVTGFIHDKEYDLIKGRKGRVEKLWIGDADRVARLIYVPQKRARKKEDRYDLRQLSPCGLAARGTRLGSKPVSKIAYEKPDD